MSGKKRDIQIFIVIDKVNECYNLIRCVTCHNSITGFFLMY